MFEISLFNRIFATLMYLVFLSPSVVLTFCIGGGRNRNNRVVLAITSAIIVILPCLLAGLRAENVGTDVFWYAKKVYLMAADSSSLKGFLLMKSKFEIGYRFISYVSSHFFRSFNTMLFVTQLLIIVPVYITALKLNYYIPAWCTMTCYYSLFYIESFNIMRQGIAVSFILLSFVELHDKKWGKALICVLIAELFHSSAIIGFALVLFVEFFGLIKSRIIRYILVILVVVGIPMILGYWIPILQLLSRIGMVSSRYASVYVKELQNDESNLTALYLTNYIKLFFRWGGLIIVFLVKNTIGKESIIAKDKSLEYSLFFATVISILIYTSVFILLHSSYGYRISMYLEMLMALWIASLTPVNKRHCLNSIPIGETVMFLCCFLCFFVIYIWKGGHGTLPFMFQIYDY